MGAATPEGLFSRDERQMSTHLSLSSGCANFLWYTGHFVQHLLEFMLDIEAFMSDISCENRKDL